MKSCSRRVNRITEQYTAAIRFVMAFARFALRVRGLAFAVRCDWRAPVGGWQGEMERRKAQARLKPGLLGPSFWLLGRLLHRN